MMSNLTEQNAQLFFATASNLLSAMERDGAAARKLMSDLTSYQQQAEARLQLAEKNIRQRLDAAAKQAVMSAMTHAKDTFDKAEASARRTTDSYEEAARRLGMRVLLICTSISVVMLIGTFLTIYFWIPSLEEIQHRRALAEAFEARASRLQWNTCNERDCVQTVELKNEDPYRTGDGRTWRIVVTQ